MAQDCGLIASEDFVLSLLKKPHLREKYHKFAFRDYVRTHPQLRFCPGPNCSVIIRATEQKAKKVLCCICNSAFW